MVLVLWQCGHLQVRSFVGTVTEFPQYGHTPFCASLNCSIPARIIMALITSPMLEKKLGSFNFRRIFQTITVDNGSEFQDWEGMTRAVDGEGDRTHIYYCHPYSAYERGSNENGNRMIRRRVPKGTDFTGITEADTLEVQRWVNEYPRGILGGRCAGRVLLELAQEAGVEGVELLL